jgi:ABC-type molybdate transport system substrate-binding protein
MICASCHKKVPVQNFCGECGAKLLNPEAPVLTSANEAVSAAASDSSEDESGGLTLANAKSLAYWYTGNQSDREMIEQIRDIDILNSMLNDKGDGFDKIESIQFAAAKAGASETCGGCTIGDGRDCSTPTHAIDEFKVVTSHNGDIRRGTLAVGYSYGGDNCSNAWRDTVEMTNVEYIRDGKSYTKQEYLDMFVNHTVLENATKELIIGTWVNADNEPYSWNSFSPDGEWIYQNLDGTVRFAFYTVKDGIAYLTDFNDALPVGEIKLQYDNKTGQLRFFGGSYVARRGDDTVIPLLTNTKMGTVTIGGVNRVFIVTDKKDK